MRGDYCYAMKQFEELRSQINEAVRALDKANIGAARKALTEARKTLKKIPKQIQVVAYVEGGNVQGARANHPDIHFGVFDVDNIEAEREALRKGEEVKTWRRAIISEHSNEEIWAEMIKEYQFPIY